MKRIGLVLIILTLALALPALAKETKGATKAKAKLEAVKPAPRLAATPAPEAKVTFTQKELEVYSQAVSQLTMIKAREDELQAEYKKLEEAKAQILASMPKGSK